MNNSKKTVSTTQGCHFILKVCVTSRKTNSSKRRANSPARDCSQQ